VQGSEEQDSDAGLDLVEGDLEDAELVQFQGFELVEVLGEKGCPGLQLAALGAVMTFQNQRGIFTPPEGAVVVLEDGAAEGVDLEVVDVGVDEDGVLQLVPQQVGAAGDVPVVEPVGLVQLVADLRGGGQAPCPRRTGCWCAAASSVSRRRCSSPSSGEAALLAEREREMRVGNHLRAVQPDRVGGEGGVQLRGFDPLAEEVGVAWCCAWWSPVVVLPVIRGGCRLLPHRPQEDVRHTVRVSFHEIG
jgi:hypothetical protein